MGSWLVAGEGFFSFAGCSVFGGGAQAAFLARLLWRGGETPRDCLGCRVMHDLQDVGWAMLP